MLQIERFTLYNLRAPVATPVAATGGVATSPSRIIQYLMTDDIEYIIKQLVDPRPASTSKKSEYINAILELNIMPINVHTLQQAIPFSNILNNSYTFNRYANLYFETDADAVASSAAEHDPITFSSPVASSSASSSASPVAAPVASPVATPGIVGIDLPGLNRAYLASSTSVAKGKAKVKEASGGAANNKEVSMKCIIIDPYMQDTEDYKKLIENINSKHDDSTHLRFIDKMDDNLQYLCMRTPIFLVLLQKFIRMRINDIFVRTHETIATSYHIGDPNITNFDKDVQTFKFLDQRDKSLNAANGNLYANVDHFVINEA
jgi:hypothetical protein